MSDTGIFATTAEVQRKVPPQSSSTANAEAYINQFMTEVESLINVSTTYNWSDNYSGLNVDVKGILKMAAASWAAAQVIKYDMSGFPTTDDAISHINALLYDYNTALALLKDSKDKQTFIKNA